MYPLFETICVKNRVAQNFEWHQKRYETSYERLYSKTPGENLGTNLYIPEEFAHGLCKLRIRYNESDKKHEFEKYVPGKVKTLKLVKADDLTYELKYSDRKKLNDLLRLKKSCDDILIGKNGKITDTSYANIVFTDGKKWFTPTTPLLEGTCRARLLAEGTIQAMDISVKNLWRFKGFNLINAMNDLDKNRFIGIDNILE